MLISYNFDGLPHQVIVLPHKNAKYDVAYTRTFKSTKIYLNKQLEDTSSIKRALFNVKNLLIV